MYRFKQTVLVKMYSVYEQGATLEEVATANGISRKALTRVFRLAGFGIRTNSNQHITGRAV